MDLSQFFGEEIIPVLNFVKNNFGYVDYSKHEQEEYINVMEAGFFLYAKEAGIINSFRLYFAAAEGFSPSPIDLRSSYSSIESIHDVMELFGAPSTPIRSIKIPGIPPTFPGYLYLEKDYKVAFHYDEKDEKVVFIQKTVLKS